MSRPDRDVSKLDPTFRERVEELLRAMTAADFDPMVWEAFRTFERAAELQRRGTGVARSMHCYGLAVDIISKSKLWGASLLFWATLARECKRLGLTSGSDFGDRPHVQALPTKEDNWVRGASATAIAERVHEHLEASDPARRPTVRERVTGKVEVPGPPKPPSSFPPKGKL